MITKKKNIIFTIGHSTHTIEDFITLLKTYHINRVVDIRTISRSRHNPQFNKEDLAKSLKKAHINYTRLPLPGGFRHARADSINTGWYNASFRGFADYMQTDNFKKGIEALLELAAHERVVLMCAEAVPWRCHRSLIGDALLVRKYDVEDIFSLTSVKPHKLTPFAQVQGTEITYPNSNS